MVDFEEVYREVLPILLRVASNITGDSFVSEELCQEAFIRYLQRGFALPTSDDVRYWLIRVVKNLCLNYVKRKQRESRAYSRFQYTEREHSSSGESEFLKTETHRLVRATLLKLPEKFRDPLVLREYANLSYKEIADALGITEGNVKIRLFRARTRLAELLDREAVHVS